MFIFQQYSSKKCKVLLGSYEGCLLIKHKITYSRQLPQEMSVIPAMYGEPLKERQIALAMQHMGGWTINGLTFSMNDAPIVVSKRGKELWVINNACFSLGYAARDLMALAIRTRESPDSPYSHTSL